MDGLQLSWGDINLYMHMLEQEITALAHRYQGLFEPIHLDADTAKNLQKSFSEQQRVYWGKWKELNDRLRDSCQPFYLPQKYQEIRDQVILND